MSVLVGSGRYAELDTFETAVHPDLAILQLPSGGFAIAWIENGSLVGYIRDANGTGVAYEILGQAPNKSSGNLGDVSLAALPSGGLVAAWTSLAGNINTRTFDAALKPTSATQTITTGNTPGSQPSVTALAGGGFVVAYTVVSQASGEDVRAQMYTAAGAFAGANLQVNATTAGNQDSPVALGLSNGGFLISWADAGGHNYAGQFYNAAGQQVGGPLSLAPGGDNFYDITTLASGNIVIVWPAADGELKGQIYSVDGVKVGAEFQVNTPTAGTDLMPDIAALDSGGFAVAWASPVTGGGNEIRAQVFDANGAATGAEFVVSDGGLLNTFPRITDFGTGDLTVSWMQVYEADPGEIVTATVSRFLFSAVEGTAGPDILNGTSARDFYFGLSGDDQLFGGDADDGLHGDAGNDLLNGEAGNDTIDGGAGDDTIDTGSSPTAFGAGDYAWGGSGADQITAGNGWDTLYSDQREDPVGYSSELLDNWFHLPTFDHGAEVDVISAGGGNDFVSIGYGDSADGGAETFSSGDRLFVSFFAAPSGITVDFTNPTIVVGGGTITGFENIDFVEGTQFNDNIRFSAVESNVFTGGYISTGGGDDHVVAGYFAHDIWGGEGNDVLDASASHYLYYVGGGPGNDVITGSTNSSGTLSGGGGDDIIHGGNGNETLAGGPGNDLIDGGAGTDRADFGSAAAGVTVALTISGPQDTGQGIDTISNIENLSGGAFADTLGGNAGSNEITGGAGDDWLYGGAGGNDRIFGEDGNDTLDGRGGAAAQLKGGNGDDTYYVDGDDTASEEEIFNLTSTGVDQVFSSATFTLGIAIENLTLTGTTAINGTGNNSNNILIGNSAANALNGGAGIDTLTGGLGVDTLTGGAQLDTFRDTATGLNGDTITDFTRGERIVITDEVAGQTLGWSNGQLTYGSASITLSNLNNASITTAAALQGGVQIVYGGPALVVAGGSSAPPAQQVDGGKAAIFANYAYAVDHSAAAGQAPIPWAETSQLYNFL